MTLVYSVLAACLCAALGYIILNQRFYQKIKILHAKKESETEVRDFSRVIRMVITAAILILAYFCCSAVFRKAKHVINILKMLSALFALSGSACVDLKEHRIPNFFPLVMSVSAVILLAVGYFTNQEGASSYIVSGIISAAGCAVLLSIAAMLTKGGIGAGDIKLLSALGLLCGVYTVSETLCISMALCALVGITALIARKKTLQETLPFGPFILAGFVVSVIFFSF